MPFQSQVNYTPALGIEGDWANANNFATAAGMMSTDVPSNSNGALAPHVAGAGGVLVGRFAWVQADGMTVLPSPVAGQTGKPTGFVGRNMNATLLTYLQEAGFGLIVGSPVTVEARGDFFVRPTTAAGRGQKVFASLTTGQASTGAAGATVTGSVETDFYAANSCLANEILIMSSNPVY